MNAYYNLTSKFQITIPKDVRQKLNIGANDRLQFTVEDGRAYIKKVMTLDEIRDMLQADLKRRKWNKVVTQEDMDNARDIFYKKGLKWE